MTKTRAELVKEALIELGAVGAGQPPAPEDAQVIDDALVPVLADLAQRDIYQYGDLDAIEDEAFLHLAKILANEKARSFGKEPDETKRLYSERRLRELQPTVLSGQPQQVEYF